MDPRRLFDLTPVGPDAFEGAGHDYPWGGLYGGHIVAQALLASARTVDSAYLPHSLRAYFIRRGRTTESVRYEVDRIRDGRSFCTRRVVARQGDGAILNLESSFQRPEATLDSSPLDGTRSLVVPDVADETWSEYVERRSLPVEVDAGVDGGGRVAAWLRIRESLGEDELLNRCALAYLSDDLPTESVVVSNPELREASESGRRFSASLDHTVWFHRPVRASQWHLYEMTCLTYVSGRGLAHGYVFDTAGAHVATVAQETLVRIAPE